MSGTVFDTTLDAAIAALLAATPLAGGNVHDGIDITEVPQDQAQALIVSMPRASAADVYGGTSAPVSWQLTLRVTAFVRHNARTAAGRPAYLLAEQAHARLMASSLGATLTPLAVAPDAEAASARLGAVDLFYTLQAYTGAADLTATA